MYDRYLPRIFDFFNDIGDRADIAEKYENNFNVLKLAALTAAITGLLSIMS